jgi:hypothetical protein
MLKGLKGDGSLRKVLPAEYRRLAPQRVAGGIDSCVSTRRLTPNLAVYHRRVLFAIAGDDRFWAA